MILPEYFWKIIQASFLNTFMVHNMHPTCPDARNPAVRPFEDGGLFFLLGLTKLHKYYSTKQVPTFPRRMLRLSPHSVGPTRGLCENRSLQHELSRDRKATLGMCNDLLGYSMEMMEAGKLDDLWPTFCIAFFKPQNLIFGAQYGQYTNYEHTTAKRSTSIATCGSLRSS